MRLASASAVEEDHRPVLCPDIRTLPIQLGWVVVVPEDTEQLIVRNLRRIKFHFHHFGTPGAIRARIIIGWFRVPPEYPTLVAVTPLTS